MRDAIKCWMNGCLSWAALETLALEYGYRLESLNQRAVPYDKGETSYFHKLRSEPAQS